MDSYNKTVWVNGANPPINAENLNHIESGIEAVNQAVTAAEGRITTSESKIGTLEQEYQAVDRDLADIMDEMLLVEKTNNKVNIINPASPSNTDYPTTTAVIEYVSDYLDKHPVSGAEKFVEVTDTSDTAVDNCTDPDTVYIVRVVSGVVTTTKMRVICTPNVAGQMAQYAMTKDGYIISRKFTASEWGVWDFIPDSKRVAAMISAAIAGKADSSAIPTKTSQLNNDSGFLTQHQDISGKENTSNKKTSISNQSQTGDSDTFYPTVGAVRDFVNLVKSDLEDYVDEEIDNIPETYTKSEVDSLVDRKAKSAYDIAVDNGYTGTQQEWIASLHAASPTVLPLSVYPNEASAVEYMDSQPDKSKVYVWNNKIYTYSEHTETQQSGACLYGYRASSSSGIIAGDGKSLFIIPVSDFETPLTIDFSGFALSNTPYIYGSTSPTTVTKTLISDDSYVGRTNPITITAAQLQNCAYVMFAVTSAGKPASAGVTVNGTAINLNVITSPSEIDSAMDSGSTTVTGYVDSGVEYAYPIDGTSGAAYLKTRSTYLPPVPRAYCESKASYEAGSHYLSKYSYSAMTSMFSAVAAAHTDYVTETNLGKDASNTYDIKKYVLNAASSLESGYTSALTNHKPVMIITAGLHGVEPDAVHTVYHFMDDLCNHYMESEELLYLHNNVKFVIVPISNPWGYVNQNYHNSNDVDINKNFEYGYRNNGSANTGTAAYSEAETQILKGVFDEYPEAVFHLECHGKYGEDTAINKTIWFSLMSSLNSELIEICADNLNSKIGMRLKELGYNTGNSTGGYITYFGLNGRPKDYTGSKYGMLSATMEGTGKIYGTSGYSVDTQKINTEALENFLLTVLSGFENRL